MNRTFCVSSRNTSSKKSCFLFSPNRNKILAAIFTLFSAHSDFTLAAPPTAWTGSVTAPCPSNFTCTDGIADQGVMQRQITDPNGDTYIQLVVTGVDGAGTNITNESFIKLNAGADGIASKFDMAHTAGNTTLAEQAILNTGWANTGGNPAIIIDFNLNDVTPSNGRNVIMDQISRVEIDRDANGNETGKYIDASQQLTNSTYITEGAFLATGTDVSTFITRRVSGTRVANNGSATLPPVFNGMMMGGMGGGGGMMQTGVFGDGMAPSGTINWSAGDEIQMTWFGQNCVGCADPGLFGGMGGGGGA
ncbi:MAG: hypothetical protein OEX19_12985, partial [Gammaproteobacteria bacterium]|nr:hypothetical protein [Gammaproteobacteria bacterium]